MLLPQETGTKELMVATRNSESAQLPDPMLMDIDVVADKATVSAGRDRGFSSRLPSRWSRRLLPVGIAVLSVIIVLIWALWLYTATWVGNSLLFIVSLIASSLSPLLVIPAGIAVWLARLAWRTRRRWFGGASAAVSVLALLAVILPLAAQVNVAGQNNVPLSLPGYLANPDPGKPTYTVTYATLAGQQLHLDVWQAASPAPDRPAVVWVHGGGWVSGDRAYDALPKWGRWLADQGITMFSVDYRLPQTGTVMMPNADVKAQEAEDVKCSLGWIEAHAGSYGANPGDLALAGDSAGGNLAMLAAYSIGTSNLPPSCPVTLTPVKAVISLYGITELPQAEVSPIAYARPGLPPTLLIRGTIDHVVPSSNASDLAARLSSVDDPYRLVDLPYADHVFDMFWGGFPTQIARGVVMQFLGQNLK